MEEPGGLANYHGMKIYKTFAVLLFALALSANPASAQYMFKFVFKGICYQKDSTGNIVGVPITDQTIIQDRATAGGVNPNTLALVYHLGGDEKGDTVEVVSSSNGSVQVFEFGFWFGSDPTLGRTALTNNAATEIRRVDQLFTLNDSAFTSNNSHGMGTAFLTKRYLTDTNGVVHFTAEGPLQWLVNPVGTNGTRICYGTFTASQVLF
jgi:hypothetical protein